jgi:hypothetical protein
MRRTVLHSLLNSNEYKSLEAKRTGKGGRRYKDTDQDDSDDKDKHHDDNAKTNANAKGGSASQAYKEYIAAYNRLTKLMAAGKGDTPAAQRAYKQYKAAKDRYEAYNK